MIKHYLPVVEIVRVEEDYDCGTFGVLRINKEAFCVTLELPDKLNEKNVSSIPAQQYMCRRYVSQRHGETFMVENVPGRDAILFHAGNTAEDTMGYILLGQYFGKLKTDWQARAVLNSGATFNNFMLAMADYDRFHLTIREAY